MIRHLFVLLVAVLVSCVSSCDNAYSIEQEEILLRYQPKEDTLLVLEIEHGIAGSTDKAADALHAAIKGRRRYPPEGGFLDVDFDDKDTLAKPGMEEQHANFLEFGKLVKVADARVFDDEEGRLSLLRLTRIEKFHHALELVNYWRNRDGESNQPFRRDFPVFDEETFSAIRAAKASGHQWLRIEGEALVLDIPMTQANAAECLAYLTQQARDEGHQDEPDVVSQITSLEMTKDHALVRFGEAPKQVLRFSSTMKRQAKDPAPLRAAIKERGVEIGDWSAVTVAEAKLGLPPPKRDK